MANVRVACAILILVAALGYGLAEYLVIESYAAPNHPSSNNIFYHLFGTYDRWAFIAWAGLGLGAIGFVARTPRAFELPIRWHSTSLVGVAIALFALMYAGTFWICLNHPLAQDEFLANFQAEIFLQGHVLQPLPAEWKVFGPAMAPVLSVYDHAKGTWAANYLPVYALLRAPFYFLGIDTALNGLLSAGAMLLTAASARRLWPQEKSAPWIAALLLGLSPQFLITGMTAYSMPAHLFFSMLWFWLWLREDRLGYALLPWVGICAMALHQPNIHLLFSAPFLTVLLFRARWWQTAYVAAIYALGCWACFEFMKLRAATPLPGAAPASLGSEVSFISSLFAVPGTGQWLKFGLNLTQFFVWQPFVLGLGILSALPFWRRWSVGLRCLAISCAFCLVFYLFARVGQGHGWGNRFMHPFLGAAALVATAGWVHLRHLPAASWLLPLSLAWSVCVELPFRAWEVHRVTAPFARADAYLRSLKAPLVVVQVRPIWYGQDLVRNHPTLNERPIFFFAESLGPPGLALLQQRGPVRIVRAQELFPLGLGDMTTFHE